jgi:2-hydroxy-6-oxonona-2,4-dienedioate hydrolase
VSQRTVIIALLAMVACIAVVWVYVSFEADMSVSRKRLEGISKIIDTKSGPIEYAESGSGSVVLVVHGAGGGFDQGLELASPLTTHGYRVIAMSRFGYLRTPMPADASVAAQAKAHVDLLDALGVSSASIFGVSAGGPSALQFAVSYPDRCKALILMVPLAYKPPETSVSGARRSPYTERILMTLVGSDFAFWFGAKYAPRLVTWTVLATPPEVLSAASKDEQLRASTFAQHILPISRRVTGIFHDATIFDSLKRLDLKSVKSPSLLITARDDLYGTFPGTEYTANTIPGAKFIAYETGGHMLIGHFAEVGAEILSFLKSSNGPSNSQ